MIAKQDKYIGRAHSLRTHPARVAVLGMALTALLLGVLGWAAWGIQQSDNQAERLHHLQGLLTTVAALDGSMTDRARMAASTGRAEWIHHFENLAPVMTGTVSRVRELAPLAGGVEAALRLQSAHQRLVSIERDALERVRQGDTAAAEKLLHGAAYVQAEQRLHEALAHLSAGTQVGADRASTTLSRRLLWGDLLAVTTLLGLFATWGAVFARLRSHTTERARWEELLKRSESQFRALIENSQDVTGILDANGVLRYESPSIEAVLGYRPGEQVGKNVMELLHPEDRTSAGEALSEVMQNPRAPRRLEARVRHRDGSWRTVRATGTNLLADPAVEGIVLNLRDVTERRQAEATLRESEARYRSVVDQAVDMIFVFDGQARITDVNRAACDGLGYTREELLRMRLSEIAVAGEMPLEEMLEAAVQGESVASGGWNRKKDGTLVPVDVRVGPVEIGDETQILAVVRDVTERRIAEEEMVRAKEAAELASHAKSDFLASMSHELRTPLNSVIGFANVLKKNKAGNLGEQDLAYLERILSNGKHLLGLINDVLDLSKIEAGKVELEITPVELEGLIVNTLDQLRGALGGKEVELRTVIPDGMAPVETDAGKLKQVLINLIGNAIKFTTRGSVTVAVAVDSETRRPVRIDVQDTGTGISPERLSAIFDPFEQAESGTARTYGGTGLGLAISRSLCELMSYRLEVESAVGEGSKFSIVLAPDERAAEAPADQERARPIPVQGREAENLTAPVDQDASLSGKLVLVIDDETDSRILLTHHLEELGCRTITASTGEQGVQMAREFRPDLITLDLLLPGMSGWETLRVLKTDPELSETPTVVVSVVAEENRGNMPGTVDLIEKPFERETLRDVLRRNLNSGERRVLIVDDEADTRDLLTTYLREEQRIEVQTAADGREALRVLEAFTPDVIVVDLLMPELDGIGLLQILQSTRRYRHIPVVIVTAKDLSPAETRSLGEEVRAILKKDAELEEDLRAVVQKILQV